MHDLEHVHVDDAAETREIREAIRAADNAELTTVGIDIGSSISHLMFAHVHLSRLATGQPLVLLIDGDAGLSLGRVIHFETAPGANVIAIDGVQLKQFDYVDIGAVIDVSNVVIVIIKSLLFR